MAKFPDTSLKIVAPDTSSITLTLGPVGPLEPAQEHNIFLGTRTLPNLILAQAKGHMHLPAAHPEGPLGPDGTWVPVGPLGPVAPCLNNSLLTQPSTPWHLGPVQPLGPLGPEGATLSNTTFSVLRLQQHENIYK